MAKDRESQRQPTIEELFQQYLQIQSARPRFSLLGKTLEEQKKELATRAYNLKQEIETRIINEPGEHQLKKIAYEWGRFTLGFDYPIKDTNFPVEKQVFSNEFYAQQSENLQPTIQFSGANRRGAAYWHTIKLPQGFRIPIGPVNFGKRIPPTVDEIADYKRAHKPSLLLRLIGKRERSDDSIREGITRFEYRYFIWEPRLDKSPHFVGFDLSSVGKENLAIDRQMHQLLQQLGKPMSSTQL